MRFGAIFAGIGLYGLFVLSGAIAALVATALPLVLFRLTRQRAVHEAEGPTPPRCGEVIAECVHCRSSDVELLERGEGTVNYALRDPNRV